MMSSYIFNRICIIKSVNYLWIHVNLIYYNIPRKINRNKLNIVSYDKKNDEENYDDNLYMDQYSSMEIDNRKNRRIDVSDDIWERHLQLEGQVESIEIAVDALSTIEHRLDSLLTQFIQLENNYKELGLKYDLLLRKFQQEIKKKDKSAPP